MKSGGNPENEGKLHHIKDSFLSCLPKRYCMSQKIKTFIV